jgi:rhodanese-related sulfurtransferase
MKLFNFLSVSFVVVLSAIGCAQKDPSQVISIDEFKNKFQNDSSIVVLDVRTPQELEGPLGKIDGVINIPVQELDQRIDELEKYKDKEILVICRTGNRSGRGTDILIEHGYKAKNVLGGMTVFRQK